jgi:hypothetical protein
MEARHAQLSNDILATLSSKERAKWNELCGKPFKFDENWRPKPPQGDRRGGPGDDGRPGPQDNPDEGAPPELEAGGSK